MENKIYTRTGDQGQTSLLNGKRVSKSHHRINAYGTVDELNSHLGVVAAELQSLLKQANLTDFVEKGLQEIQKIQNRLFSIGSHLACEDPKGLQNIPPLGTGLCEHLEQQIDEWSKSLPELKEFILPGGCHISASLHVARSVCRRAERLVVKLEEQDQWFEPLVLTYLNRLSDYLFVFARYTNSQLGFVDISWKK